MTAPEQPDWPVVAFIVIVVVLILMAAGCGESIQPVQLEPGEQSIMLIPKGTRIGYENRGRSDRR